ncbi:MAG: mannose-1-phosphate guanylyltransferase [Planctomycetes bacterium]|nr:mannose-1-phosphate guanylyltransferase [Planctomycetota bacterium]
MVQPPLYAILLAGGTGTRFWPASRKSRPKQFLRIVGERSMLAETHARLAGVVEPEHTLVVTTRDQLDLVRATLPEIPERNVLAEPQGRNTGPCIALAALEVRRRAPEAVQIVLPADHVIRPREAFQSTLRAAVDVALDQRSLLVFGIHPSFPATAFGWIKAGAVESISRGQPVHSVERFVEKPALARAREFLEQGGYFWNSGMFVWSSAAIAAALAEFMPAAHAALQQPLAPAELERAYAQLDSVAIDVAVLERARSVRMLPISYFWSDVGSWDALGTVIAPDADGNVASGGARLVTSDASGCIAYGAEGSLVALIGVDDLIVVQTGPTTLVCRRDRAQDVKRIVERLQAERSEFL